MTANNRTYDVIVVGGGIVGASAAYHAAKAGATTLLIDRHDTGRATDAGAGILAPEMNRRDPQSWFDFAVDAVGYYPELVRGLSNVAAGETSYAVCGMLLVAASEYEVDAFNQAQTIVMDRQTARSSPAADDLFPISSGEARELFPALDNVYGALYYRNAARVDGRQLATALRRGGEYHNLVVQHTSVEQLLLAGSRAEGVGTQEGEYRAGATIIAGGAWSNSFGRQLAVAIPVEPQRGQIAHLQFAKTDTTEWPIVGAMQGHYIVPWEAGRVAIGATRETGSGYDTETTAAGIHEVLSEGLRVAPGLGRARLLEVRVGLRPFPRDGLPVLGAVPDWDGLLLATGHGPTGLQLGPYSGKLVAEMALHQEPASDISAFSIARFATT